MNSTTEQKIRYEGVPSSLTASILVDHLKTHGVQGKPWIHVVPQGKDAEDMKQILTFWAPDLSVVIFPEWSTPPYDRLSPSIESMARRNTTRLDLLRHRTQTLVLTTPRALLQRLSPLSHGDPHYAVDQTVPRSDLINQLMQQGYTRTDVVRSIGEFAVRGGLIDLFTPSSPLPVRIDFFGDEIQSIKTFDPLSQRTQSNLQDFTCPPVKELLIREENHTCFERVAPTFLTPESCDLIDENLRQERIVPGLEQYLPLFFRP